MRTYVLVVLRWALLTRCDADVQLAPEVCLLWIVCWTGYQQHLSVLDLGVLAFVQGLQRFSESSVIVMPQRLRPQLPCPFSCFSPHKAPNPRLRTRRYSGRKRGLSRKRGLCWFSPDWLVIPCAVPDRKHKSYLALSLQGTKKMLRAWSFHRSGKISAWIWRTVFFFLPLHTPNVDSAGKSGKEASRERVNRRM